jgi:hypothetical protein
MVADKIFYADAHQHVIVTESTFIVKDKQYNIPNIRDHIIKEIKPTPLPGLAVSILGALVTAGGIFNFIGFSFLPNVSVMEWTFGPYSWSILGGLILLFAGLFMMTMVKPRYALHISTAEGGENDVLVSPKREYVKQIIDALNRAFMLRAK